MILQTKRLILRPWSEDDAEQCYKYASDPDVGPAAGWQPHTSVEYSRDIIKNVLSKPEMYAVILKETSLPVGNIALRFHSDLAKFDDECEIGYWLGKPYWGQGIMPEAATELIRRAFEDLGLERVWGGYYDGNEKSKRVQEKCGLKHMWTSENVPVPDLGEFRVGHVNCITKKEWQKQRISRFENILDELSAAVKDLDFALEAYEKLKPRLNELKEYYESSLWKKDFEDDGAGRLPKDLKRGVLSEDAVYDLLDNIKELEIRGKNVF